MSTRLLTALLNTFTLNDMAREHKTHTRSAEHKPLSEMTDFIGEMYHVHSIK